MLRTFIFLLIFSAAAMAQSEITKTVDIQPPKPGELPDMEVPFNVPEPAKSFSIRWEYDKKGGANRLEFGLAGPRIARNFKVFPAFWGWSGAIRDSIFIADDRATHGYRVPGIAYGDWKVIIGLAKVSEPLKLTLRISFDKIDEAALKQWEAENAKTFKYEKFPKPAPINSGGYRWFRGDLHAHTVHGDGSWTVSGAVEAARSNGLDFVALTEHNTASHFAEIDELSKKYPGMLILRGEEVTTYGGHINVWGLPTQGWVDFRLRPGDIESARNLANEAHQYGALASINHPTLPCYGCNWTYDTDWSTLDSVEIWNATWDKDDEAALKKWDELLQQGKRIVAIGSSDTHQPPYEKSPYPTNLTPGNPSVFVGAKSLTQTEILAGIKAGRVFTAAHPRYSLAMRLDAPVQGLKPNYTGIGESIPVRSNRALRLLIDLKGFEKDAKVQVISDGRIVWEAGVGGDRFAVSRSFNYSGQRYVRLEVRSADGKMLAFTNPIYLTGVDL